MKSSLFTKWMLKAVVVGQVAFCLAILLAGVAQVEAATSSSSSSQSTKLEEDCGKFSEEMQKARESDLANRMNAYSKAQAAATEEARKKMVDPVLRTPLGDIRMTMCLDYISNFYNAIYALLSRVNWVIMAINAIINQLINYACNYVATTINNALTSLCVPLPDLSLGLGLSQGSAKTCNGLSLGDLVHTVSKPPYIVPGTSPAPINPMKYLPLSRGRPTTGSSQ